MDIRTQRIGHVTFIGSNETDTVAFYQGVLGMPLVLRQPNLDEPETLHLFFDAGGSSYLTFFVRADKVTDPTPVPWAVGSVHHVAMDLNQDAFDRALTGLGDARIPNSGRVDRGVFWSLYFRDPNGMLLELSSWKVPVPPDMDKGAVLKRAQELREADGSYNATADHVRQALEELRTKAVSGAGNV